MMNLSTFLLMMVALVLPANYVNGEPSHSAYARIDSALFQPGAYPIAWPLKGGALRVLFIGPGEETGYVCRETVSRLECGFDAVLTAGRERLGDPQLPANDETWGDDAVANRFKTLLAERWDAIWLDFSFESLSAPLQDALRAQVERGAGLVYRGAVHDLRRLAGKGKFNRSLLRAVATPEGATEFAGYCGEGRMLAIPRTDVELDARRAGDFCIRIVHALILASGREGDVFVTGLEHTGRGVEHESIALMSHRLDFENNGPESPRVIRSRYRDRNGAVVAQSDDTYLLKKGKGFVRVSYPLLPVGEYSVDLSILDSGTVVAVGWTSFQVESEDGLAELDVKNQLVRSGEFVVGRVRTTREVQDGMGLRLELVDAGGHRLDVSEIAPTPRQFGAGFALKANSAAGGYSTIRADLFKNNVLVHRMETPLMIIGEHAGSFRLSGIEERKSDFPRDAGYSMLAKSGLSRLMADMTGLGPNEAVKKVMGIFPSGFEATPSFFLKTGVEESGTVLPSTHAISAVADTLRRLGLRTYMFRIDPGRMGTGMGYSPEALASLRSFLGARYGNIDRLNAAWGSAYFGFEAVKPTEGNNTVARVDRLLHAREWSRQRVGDFGRVVARSDTGVHIILSEKFDGALRVGKSTGVDAREMPIEKGIRYSPTVEFDGLENLQAAREIPWQCLFEGLDGLWWKGLAGVEGAALVPGYGLHPVFDALAGECRVIGRGIHHLLHGAQRLHDPVAILDMTDFLPEDRRVEVRDAVESFHALSVDCGHIPRLFPLDLLRKSWLDSMRVQVLILPGIREIDPISAGCIEGFVRGGGTVIADVRPVVMGERDPRSGGPSSDRLLLHPDGDGSGTDSTYAKGMLLNFDIAGYQSARGDVNGASLREIMKDALVSSGVMPWISTDPGQVAGGTYSVFQNDQALFLGYLPDHSRSETAESSGVMMGNRTGNRRYVYNVREERYLGMLPDAAQRLSSARPTVLAILPYRVNDVEMSFDKMVLRPGETCVSQCAIQVQDSDAVVGRHVFEVCFLRPDGSADYGYGGVYVSENGKFQMNHSFGETDPIGKWTVTVKDVASGKRVEKSLILMPRVGNF